MNTELATLLVRHKVERAEYKLVLADAEVERVDREDDVGNRLRAKEGVISAVANLKRAINSLEDNERDITEERTTKARVEKMKARVSNIACHCPSTRWALIHGSTCDSNGLCSRQVGLRAR